MGKNSYDDDKFEDDGLDLNIDEFFPLDDDLESGFEGDGKSPPSFKSYTKMLGKSALHGAKTLGETFLPSVSDLIMQLGFAKDTAVEEAKSQIEKASEMAKKQTGGKNLRQIAKSMGEEIVGELKQAVKTGDFRFQDKMDFGFDDFDDDEDASVQATEKLAETTVEASKDSIKANFAIHESTMKQNAKLYASAEAGENVRHVQSVGYLANLDSNVSKITKFIGTVGAQTSAAQIEYYEKNLAMQQDVVKLLNTIKEQTFSPRNDDLSDSEREESEMAAVFGGGFDGSRWMENVIKNAKGMLEDSPLGMMASSLGGYADMKETSGDSLFSGKGLMKGLLGAIPGLFLSTEARMKLGNLNEMFEDLPRILSSKFNRMALTSDNPILRSIGGLLGVKDISTTTVDFGIKDLGAKATFDQKFYRTVTDAIPGLLSKILAVSSGQGEIYYDLKAGTFKTAEHAVRSYKMEEETVYDSSHKLNLSKEKFKSKSTDVLLDLDPEADITSDEFRERNRIFNEDIEQIVRNMGRHNIDFDADVILNDKNIQALLSEGVKDPNNILAFARMMQKEIKDGDKVIQKSYLASGDLSTFKSGVTELQRDLSRFSREQTKDFIESMGGGADHVKGLILDRQMARDAHTREFLDKGWEGDGLGSTSHQRKKFEEDKRIKMAMGGRSGSIEAHDPSLIGDVATKGIANTQIGVLSNIYELLLGGILVYPQKRIPSNLLATMENYNVAKRKIVEYNELEEKAKIEEDEELSNERLRLRMKELEKTDAYGQFLTSATDKFIPKDLVSGKITSVTDWLTHQINRLTLGPDYERYTGDGGFSVLDERILKAKDSSADVVDSLRNILGEKTTPKSKDLLKGTVEYKDFDKEFEELEKDESIKNKFDLFLRKIQSKIAQELWGGEINVEKLKELERDKVLGDVKKPEGIQIRELQLPGESSGIEYSKSGEKIRKQPGKVVDKVDKIKDKMLSHLSSIDKNVKDIYSVIKVKLGKDKKDSTSLDSSYSVTSAVDKLRETNKEFFDKVLESGIFDSIKSMDENIKLLGGNFDIALSLMVSGDIGKLNIGDFKRSPRIKSLPKKVYDKAVRLVVGGKNIITHSIKKGYEGVTGALPGLGKGIGEFVSTISGSLKTILSSVGVGINNVVKTITDSKTLAKIRDLGIGALSGIGTGAMALGKGIKGIATGGYGALKKYIPKSLKGIGTAGKGIFEKIKKAGGFGLDKIKKGGKFGFDKIKGLFEKVLGIEDKDRDEKITGFGTDEVERRPHMSTEDAINEMLHEVTIIRTGLGKWRSDHKEKGRLGKGIDIAKNAFGLLGKGAVGAWNLGGKAVKGIKGKFFGDHDDEEDQKEKIPFKEKIKSYFSKKSDILQSEKEEDQKEKIPFKEKIKSYFSKKSDILQSEKEEVSTGSLEQQRKETREQEMYEMERESIKLLLDIRNNLENLVITSGGEPAERSESKGGGHGTLAKILKTGGTIAGVVGAAGAALFAGNRLKDSTLGQHQLAKETGLYDEGSTGDIAGQYLGAERGSRYGFDGRLLSDKERRQQSGSLMDAPQGAATTIGIFKAGQGIKKGLHAAGRGVGRVTGAASRVAGRVAPRATQTAQKVGGVAQALKNPIGAFKTLISKMLGNSRIARMLGKVGVKLKTSLPRLLNARVIKRAGPSILGKFATKIGQVFTGPIGWGILIAMILKDFISGWNSAGRFFNLGGAVKPTWGMKTTAALSNVLSGFLVGLIPPDTITNFIWGIVGGEESKEALRRVEIYNSRRADYLGVPAGPLAEFETKGLWARMFGSGKKDANMLGFKSMDEFEEWKTGLYETSEKLRERISEKYGGEKAVSLLSGDPETVEAFKEEYLSKLNEKSKLYKNEKEDSEEEDELDELKDDLTDKEKLVDDEEVSEYEREKVLESGEILDNSKVEKLSENSENLNIDGSSDIEEDISNLSIKDAERDFDEIKKLKKRAGEIRESVTDDDENTTENVLGRKTATEKTYDRTFDTSNVIQDETETTEKRGIGSPVVTAMNEVTKNINTELDALRAIYMEQNRHNTVSEEFYKNAIMLMTMLIEGSKTSVELDVDRNEILSKALLMDISPSYRRKMMGPEALKKEEDERGLLSRLRETGGNVWDRARTAFGFGGSNDETPASVTGGSASEPSASIPAGIVPPGSIKVDSSNFDSGEASYSGGDEVDLSEFESLDPGMEDGVFSFEKDADAFKKLIEEYQKENSVNRELLRAFDSSREISDYVMKCISGSSPSHELFQGSIPIVHKGKRIGMRYIYVPKSVGGKREGDVITVSKYVNGEVEYSIDNTGKYTSGLNIDYSKGMGGSGEAGVILNINEQPSRRSNDSTVNRMSEVVSQGGREI